MKLKHKERPKEFNLAGRFSCKYFTINFNSGSGGVVPPQRKEAGIYFNCSSTETGAYIKFSGCPSL